MGDAWIGLLGVLVGALISTGVTTGWEFWRSRTVRKEQEEVAQAEFVMVCRLFCDEVGMAAAMLAIVAEGSAKEGFNRVHLSDEIVALLECPSWVAARPLLVDPRHGVDRLDVMSIQVAMTQLRLAATSAALMDKRGVPVGQLRGVAGDLSEAEETLRQYAILPTVLGDLTTVKDVARSFMQADGEAPPPEPAEQPPETLASDAPPPHQEPD